MAQKLRQKSEESRIVRLRTKKQHEENTEVMLTSDKLYGDLDLWGCAEALLEKAWIRNAKEEDFERLQQEKREEVKLSSTSPLNAKEQRIKVDEYRKFVEIQDKEMEINVAEEEKLRQAHEDNIAAMRLRLRHFEEEMQLEKKFNEELAKLMEKYSPSQA